MKLNISLHDIDLLSELPTYEERFSFFAISYSHSQKEKKENFWNFIYFEFFMLSRASNMEDDENAMRRILFFLLAGRRILSKTAICWYVMKESPWWDMRLWGDIQHSHRGEKDVMSAKKMQRKFIIYAIWMMSTLCEQRKFAQNSSLYLDLHDWTRNLAT